MCVCVCVRAPVGWDGRKVRSKSSVNDADIDKVRDREFVW